MKTTKAWRILKNKLTPAEIVRSKYPNAKAIMEDTGWKVVMFDVPGMRITISYYCSSRKEAWKSAATAILEYESR